MTHVGVQRFGPSDREQHGTQDNEGCEPVARYKLQCMDRVKSVENGGCLHNIPDAGRADGKEPQSAYRPEEQSDYAGAVPLHREQGQEDADRYRHDVGFECRRAHFQALNRGKHRDRGGQNGIAIKQCGAEDADGKKCIAQTRTIAHRCGRKRQQRHDAALAAIAGPEDQRHILERNDDHQRPEDRRHAADDVGRRQRNAVVRIEGFLRGIKGARADIAVHDAKRKEGKRGRRLPRFRKGERR